MATDPYTDPQHFDFHSSRNAVTLASGSKSDCSLHDPQIRPSDSLIHSPPRKPNAILCGDERGNGELLPWPSQQFGSATSFGIGSAHSTFGTPWIQSMNQTFDNQNAMIGVPSSTPYKNAHRENPSLHPDNSITQRNLLPMPGSKEGFVTQDQSAIRTAVPLESIPLSQESQRRPRTRTRGPACCSQCSLTIKRKSDLARHMKVAHGTGTMLFCPMDQCNYSYVRLDKLKDHIRRMHSEIASSLLARLGSYEEQTVQSLLQPANVVMEGPQNLESHFQYTEGRKGNQSLGHNQPPVTRNDRSDISRRPSLENTRLEREIARLTAENNLLRDLVLHRMTQSKSP